MLAIGLLSVGVGTMAFLRTTLLQSLDSNLETIARTDVLSQLFTLGYQNGELVFAHREDAVPTEYYVAVYDSTGAQVATGGGRETDTSVPVFPDEYRLDVAYQKQSDTLILDGTGVSNFHARTVVAQVTGTNDFYTELVALPTAPVTQVVTAYTAIFGILALVTIAVAAALTRWIVTLTFRSLGQVESTAMTIAAGDFSQRMTGVEPTTTEVGRLKTAINAMLGRIDGALSERDSTVRQMRRFIGDASHELRTPLVSVRGYAELYRMGAIRGDEAVAQAMERIEKEAIRMGVLVEDLLALARLDERRDVAIAPVDLRPVTRDAAMDVLAASPERPVTVTDTTVPPETTLTGSLVTPADLPPSSPRRRASPLTAVGARLASLRRRRPADPAPATAPLPVIAEIAAPDPSPHPIVLGDENRIRQVVANLLGNARRFSPAGSPIELRVGVDPAAETGWFDVIDHGDGIPEQIREQIFQRFWRADTSRARETGGSGLGLSIVASIVETLHGTVQVTDTPGGGATFRVSLPLAPADERERQAYVETQPIEPLEL